MDVPTLLEILVSLGFSRNEALTVWRPLLLYLFGMVVYSVFIFRFYRFVARRDIMELKLDRYSSGFKGFLSSFFKTFFYIVQYLLLYPFLSVLWFFFFTIVLAVMGPSFAVDKLVILSMAIVSSIRITSYYDELLSQDLAKMIPFALLGVFLVEGSLRTSMFDIVNTVEGILGMWKTVAYYLVLLIFIEMVLRFVTWIINGTLETVDEEVEEER